MKYNQLTTVGGTPARFKNWCSDGEMARLTVDSDVGNYKLWIVIPSRWLDT